MIQRNESTVIMGNGKKKNDNEERIVIEEKVTV